MVITPQKKQTHPVFRLPENKKQTEAQNPDKRTDHRPGSKCKNHIGLIPPPKWNIESGFPVVNFSRDLERGSDTGSHCHVGKIIYQIAPHKHAVGVNG